MGAYPGLYTTSVKWNEGPNPRISIAATRDVVPVRGSPAPITWTMSLAALRSILAGGICILTLNMLRCRRRRKSVYFEDGLNTLMAKIEFNIFPEKVK